MDNAKIFRSIKSALTRAENSGDPEKILAACEDAEAKFDAHGWPDWHSRVARMRSDAQFSVQRARY